MEKQYTQGIYIDGIYYDVPLLSIKRTGDFLDKYANRLEDGDLQRELIGVYFNYSVTFGVMDTDIHEALWDKLSEPVPFHEITVPSGRGSYTYTGYVSGLSDEVLKIYDDRVEMQNLTFKMTAKQPARKPV